MNTSQEIRRKLNELNAQREEISKQIDEESKALELAKQKEAEPKMCYVEDIKDFITLMNLSISKFTWVEENDTDEIKVKKLNARKDMLKGIASVLKDKYSDVLKSIGADVTVITTVRQAIDTISGKTRRTSFNDISMSLEKIEETPNEESTVPEAWEAVGDMEQELGRVYPQFKTTRLAATQGKKVDLKSLITRYNSLVTKLNVILKLAEDKFTTIPEDLTVADAVSLILKATKEIVKFVKSIKKKKD